MPFEGQKPPPLLQIVRDKLKPGTEQDYGKIEEELARACFRLGAPNPYLALASITPPADVWWLNMYASESAGDRIKEGYERNTALMTTLRELSAKKVGLTDVPIDLMTKFRNDLSSSDAWRIGELRYAVVQELQAAASSAGAVFESAEGLAFVLVAAADRQTAEQRALPLGPAARIFEVRPRWSLPHDRWVSTNPQLWRPQEVQARTS
jgi:hypothetical protein